MTNLKKKKESDTVSVQIPVYRVYDTVEKKHREDLFVNTKGEVCDWGRYGMLPMSDQGRYIIERCTGKYDKNNVLVYENDAFWGVGRKGYVIFVDGNFSGKCFDKSMPFIDSLDRLITLDLHEGECTVIGHALKNSHLLEDTHTVSE